MKFLDDFIMMIVIGAFALAFGLGFLLGAIVL